MQWSVVGEVTAVNVGLRLREEERGREEEKEKEREGGREGGREKRKRGRRGGEGWWAERKAVSESRREKSSWCVFLFPKVNICYHKLTHSQYAHITPTILCNNTHTYCMQAFILKIVKYVGTKFDCENFGGGIISLVPRPCTMFIACTVIFCTAM